MEYHNFFDGERILIMWAFRISSWNLKSTINSCQKINKMNQIFAIFQAKIAKKMPTFGPFCRFLSRKFPLILILKKVSECSYYQLSFSVKISSKFQIDHWNNWSIVKTMILLLWHTCSHVLSISEKSMWNIMIFLMAKEYW